MQFKKNRHIVKLITLPENFIEKLETCYLIINQEMHSQDASLDLSAQSIMKDELSWEIQREKPSS